MVFFGSNTSCVGAVDEQKTLCQHIVLCKHKVYCKCAVVSKHHSEQLFRGYFTATIPLSLQNTLKLLH